MRLRHVTRAAVLVVLGVLFVLNDYFRLKGQYGGQKVIDASGLYRRLDAWLGASRHLRPFDAFATGSLWSFAVGGLRVSDPLAVLSAPDLLWWTAILPVAATVLLGRVFCGWVCPMGLLSEAVSTARRAAARGGLKFFALGVSPRLKYVVLGVGLVALACGTVSFFYAIYPPRVISDLLRDALVGVVRAGDWAFLGAILLVELLFIERLWCRCLCPGGAVYSLLGAGRVLRIRRDEDRCTACGDCDVHCPHDLAPSRLRPGCECDNCGICRRVCRPGALSFRLALRRGSREADDDR